MGVEELDSSTLKTVVELISKITNRIANFTGRFRSTAFIVCRPSKDDVPDVYRIDLFILCDPDSCSSGDFESVL